MLAAPPAPVEPLPAHRIALRAALCAAAGSLAGAVVGVPLVVLSGTHRPDLLTLLAIGGTVAMAAFFVVAVELVRRLPARGRLAALAVLGALSPGFALCSLIWVHQLAQGRGPERAGQEILRFLTQVGSRPDKLLPGAAAVLIPFALAGAAHAGGLPGLLGRAPNLPARVALAAVTGAVALAIAWSWYTPWGGDRRLIVGFLLLPPALELAIAWGLRGEARLLAWWAKRREAA